MSYRHPDSMRGHVAIVTGAVHGLVNNAIAGQTIHVDGGIGSFR